LLCSFRRNRSEDTVRKNNDIPEDIEAGGEILGPDGVVKGTITAYLLTQDRQEELKLELKRLKPLRNQGELRKLLPRLMDYCLRKNR